MELLGDIGLVEAHFGPFEENVNLSARYVSICAGCTMGMEIVLGTPDGTPR
jgi:fructose/tagatose bisphosphate aldolase